MLRLLALAVLAGCVGTGGAGGPATARPAATPIEPAGGGSAGVPGPAGVPTATPGTPAASQRRTFTPTRITLLSDHHASTRVDGVDTGPTGALQLPVDPGRVGFWQGGSLAGELFGSVVLAGHIDSRARGIGFFARLLDVHPGDRVELSGEGSRLVYVVRSTGEVGKAALGADAALFDRRAPGRLVLITCTGRFDPVTGHYDHNLVVVADPLGAPTGS